MPTGIEVELLLLLLIQTLGMSIFASWNAARSDGCLREPGLVGSKHGIAPLGRYHCVAQWSSIGLAPANNRYASTSNAVMS